MLQQKMKEPRLKSKVLDVSPQKTAMRGRWYSPVPEICLDEYRVVPLHSAKSVKSEGYWMSHCVKHYIELCVAGAYRLFSIRNWSGERLATLGVKNQDNYWVFDQCYGPSNSDVLHEEREYSDDLGCIQQEKELSEVYFVAHEIVRMMNVCQSLSPMSESRDFAH